MSKRFLIDKAIYNSLADLPSKGSCFGVIGNAPISISDSFSIPAYSRFAFINTGDSTDGALLAIDSNGNIYSAYRNNGIWNTGQVSASKSDLIQDGVYDITTDSNGSIAINSVVSGVTIDRFAGAYFYDETAEANVLTRIHLYKKYVFAVAINPDSNAKYVNKAMKMHIWYRKS